MFRPLKNAHMKHCLTGDHDGCKSTSKDTRDNHTFLSLLSLERIQVPNKCVSSNTGVTSKSRKNVKLLETSLLEQPTSVEKMSDEQE